MKWWGVCYWCAKIPQCRYMEHGLKDIAFYVQNIQQFELSCHNFPLVRDKLPEGARICETGLLTAWCLLFCVTLTFDLTYEFWFIIFAFVSAPAWGVLWGGRSRRRSVCTLHSKYLRDSQSLLNTLRSRQNGQHFPDIFKCILLNENVWILHKISLKFVPKVHINNIPGLVQIMAWLQPGNKPLSEPIMVKLLMHICITRPQWVNP